MTNSYIMDVEKDVMALEQKLKTFVRAAKEDREREGNKPLGGHYPENHNCLGTLGMNLHSLERIITEAKKECPGQ